MRVATPMTVNQFADQVDEALDMPANVDDMFTPEEPDNSPCVPGTDEAQTDLSNTTEAQTDLSAEDKEERLFWDKCETLGKIKDCARMIEEVEAEVDGYQDSIKEAKEVLKGQQALLARYSSQLADVMDGHPLPRNPNAPTSSGDAESLSDPASGADWRDMPTEQLLEGVKGLGPRKLEAIVELAPTAGKLEALRGEASMAHKLFYKVLPKGCGESMAEEIENRLIEHIAKWSEVESDDADPGDDGEYEDVE